MHPQSPIISMNVVMLPLETRTRRNVSIVERNKTGSFFFFRSTQKEKQAKSNTGHHYHNQHYL
jgi:hypothetical protein